jgi:hypothetical protein
MLANRETRCDKLKASRLPDECELIFTYETFIMKNGSKREEWSDFRATSDHSAPRASSSTIPKGTRLTV